MNEEEAKRLMRKALDADRIIHTQQLGLPWEQPRHWFLNNIGPLRRYKAKRMATKLAAEVLAGGTEPLAPLWHWETQFQVSQLASWALWGPFQVSGNNWDFPGGSHSGQCWFGEHGQSI